MAGIIVLTAWPIRGDCFPHENGGKLTLTYLFCWFDGKRNSVKLTLQNKAPDINYVHTKRHFRRR